MFSHPSSAVLRCHYALLTLGILALLAGLGAPLAAQPYDVVQEYHVPIASRNVRAFAQSINTTNSGTTTGTAPSTVHEVISLTALRANTIVVYDQWEDGFEADLTNPASIFGSGGTTQIWGDNDPSNGIPPGFVTDVIGADAFIVLENDVNANPRDPATVVFDGDDRIGVTEVIAMTRAGWRLQESTLLAGAVEVFPTYLWGNEFEVPIGQDWNPACTSTAANNGLVAATASCMFEYTAVSITATVSGAAYNVDYDGDGTDDFFGVLGPGESRLIPNVFTGTRITSTDPLEAHILSGDVGSTYEGRWFNLVPLAQWSDEYYSPVGSATFSNEGGVTRGQPTDVLLYNPSASAIDIDVDRRVLTPSGATTGGTQGANISMGDGTCPAVVTRTITVPATGEVITDLDIRFQATSDFRGDMDIDLISPTGVRVNIIAVNTGDGDNNYDVRLDDGSANPLDDGDADTIGGGTRFAQPANLLSAFDGQNPSGNWTLEMCDDFAGGDPSTFEDAELFIATGTSTLTTSTVNVPANSLSFFRMPVDSGARFTSTGGEDFFAISTVDYNNTSSDWGFTLLPSPQLTTAVVAGWAPGRNPASGVNPTENGSPIWVTAAAATTLRIDYDGDGTFDVTGVPINELQSLTIFDPNDQDQNGMVIESETGVLITAAWGQDARVASPAAPAIDVGTTVVPVPVLDLTKDVALFEDVGGDGSPDAGDTLLYTITVRNVGTTDALNVVLEDPVIDPDTTYVAMSTELDGSPIADDGVGATIFPLDEGGILLGTILTSAERVITFRVTINSDNVEILNTAIVTSPTGGGTSSTVVPVVDPDIALTKVSDVVGFAEAGDVITYTLTLTNTGPTPQQGININDVLPAGTSYVANSTSVTGFDLELFQALDLFRALPPSYANQNAPGYDPGPPIENGWSTNWIEVNDDGAPGGGGIEIEGGELRLDNSNDTGDLESIYRSVNLTGLPDNRRLSLIYRLGAGVDTTDRAAVQVYNGTGNPAGLGGACASYVVNATADDGIFPPEDLPAVAGPRSDFLGIDLPAGCNAATLTVRVALTNGYTGADEFFAVDNVQVTASNTSAIVVTNDGGGGAQLTDGTPPSLVSAPDGFGLDPGQSMTVTFQVQVDNPLDPFRPSIVNTATATTIDNPFPVFATVIDPVSEGGSIGDRVWIDIDGDGVDDVGEPGIANVTVTLYDAGGDMLPGGGDDTLLETTVTDTNGNYLFDNLPPGTYYVDVTNADIPTGLALSPGSTDPSAVRTITGNEAFFDVDFGYRNASTTTAIIGDLVWSDGNGDGVRQPNEPGIGGVTVDLIDLGPDGIAGTPDDSVSQTTTTDVDGSYLFVAAAPASYVVRVTDTGNVLSDRGLTFSPGPQSISNPSAPITVITDDVYLEADFGYVGDTNDIFDSVWIDSNNDGFFNPAETGVEGVTVSLVDTVSGDTIATASTDANGDFSFVGLADGDYRLVITDTNNRLNNLGPTTPGAGAGFINVTMAGADISNESFGYNAPGVIGDTVWNDAANADDLFPMRDPGESGFADIEINLYRDLGTVGTFEPGAADTLVATTFTNSFGNYSFVGLEPGNYWVSICTEDTGAATEPDCSNTGLNELPTGYALTTDDDAAAAGVQMLSALAVGESDLTRDFGFRNNGLADISGTVFDDEDRDGVEEPPADVGIADVKVVLLDSGGNMIAMTRTDSNGDYSFPDLPAGDYTVEVVPDDSPVLVDYELTSGLDTIDITLAGTDIDDVDFGYAKNTPTGSIGDKVFNDANRDGIQNGDETGVSNVLVALYDAGPDGIADTADDVQLATDTTDVFGDYLFEGLTAGNYFVRVLDAYDGNGSGNGDAYGNPMTFLAGFERTDANGLGADSDVISLSEGENRRDADFGYAVDAGPPDVRGSIGDLVWLDADSDGVLDAGEPGIAGVRLDLFDLGDDGAIGGTGANADTYVSSTLTDQNGLYRFANLQPASYLVQVADATDTAGEPSPNGDEVGDVNTPLEGLERTPAPQTDSNSVVVVLGDNENRLDIDFSYGPSGGLAVLGDTVFHDSANFGTQDAGELGIPGILVTAVPSGGGTPVTTTTDASGNYLFLLPTGVAYDVSVCESGDPAPCTADNSVPAGLTQTTLGGSNPFTTPALPASGNLTVDFGFSGGGTYATIGDTVFRDNGNNGGTANNGVQDGSEPGIPNVTLNLIDVASGTQIASTTTDGSGNYSFTGLDPDRDYRVEVDNATLPAGLYPTTPNPPTVLFDGNVPASVLTAGGTYNDADFGFNGSNTGEPGSIGDRVFLDADGSGVQDPGERGIGGVTVELYDAGPDGAIGGGDDVFVASAVTAPDGFYRFDDVPAGTYYVLNTDTTLGVGDSAPLPTDPPLVLQGLTRSDANGPGGSTLTDTSALIYLADGQEFTEADFGYEPLGPLNGLIGDTVYYDVNGNGTQDSGELGLPGIRVIITPQGDAENCGVLGTSICVDTDAAGNYLVSVPADDYTVSVCTSTSSAAAGCNAGNTVPPALDPAIDGVNPATEFPIPPVTVPGGGVNLDADFGFDEDSGNTFVTIGDRVYLDANGNGVLDGGETGIAGVTLDLVDAATGNVIGQTTTDSTGNYLFSGVPVATGTTTDPAYTVVVTDQTGELGGLSPTQSGGTVLIGDVDAPGDVYLDADFGFTTQQQLGDTVFVDVIDGAGNLTPDGFQQHNELGIPGVLVVVVPQSEASNPTITCGGTTQCVTTDAQGKWSVLVPSGTYTVFVCSDLPGWPGPTPTNCDPTPVTGNEVPAGFDQLTTSFAFSGTRNPQTFNVGTGVSILYADFGFQDSDSSDTTTIGDRVYFDLNGDGDDESGGDPGIQNVTLELIDLGDDGVLGGTGANADTSVATAVTDANGNYTFYGVNPNRSYQVVVTDEANLLGTLNPTEGAPDGTEIVPASSLTAGVPFEDADFGYDASGGVGAIGNKIWRDLTDPDGDPLNGPPNGVTGFFQTGEPGIESVSVELWRDNGSPGDPNTPDGIIQPGVDDLERTVFTDSLGNYEFLGLPVEVQYIVRVTDELQVLGGMTLATCTATGVGEPCEDPTADNVSKTNDYVVNLTLAEPNNFAADFGYEPVVSRTLSGLVYFDGNDSNDYDSISDRGEPDVLVTLFRELPAVRGTASYVFYGQLRTTLTNTSGPADLNYLFTDLPEANWQVVVNNAGTFLDGAEQTEPDESPATATRNATTVGGDATEVDFGFYRAPTLVVITEVHSILVGGEVALRFETGSEIGSLGFYVWRLDPVTDDYVQVNEEMVPAVNAPQGAVYTIPDPEASAGQLTYVIYEVEMRGGEQAYGPIHVETEESDGLVGVIERLDTGPIAEPKQPSERDVRRFARAQAEERLMVTDPAAVVGTNRALRRTRSVTAQIRVTEGGLQRLDSTAIAAATGQNQQVVEAWITANNWQLRLGQRAVAWYPSPDGTAILFYAPEPTSKFSPWTAYSLTRGRGLGMSSNVANAANGPTSIIDDVIVGEEDTTPILSSVVDEERDVWFWAIMGGSTRPQLQLDIPGATGAGGLLEVQLYGASDFAPAIDHRVEVWLNPADAANPQPSESLGVVEFGGFGDRRVQIAVPAGVLQSGVNTFVFDSLPLPSGGKGVSFVDWFRVHTQRSVIASNGSAVFTANATTSTVAGLPLGEAVEVFELGGTVRRLAGVSTSGDTASFATEVGRRYFVTTSGSQRTPTAQPWATLEDDGAGAEYVVIVPAQLRAAADRLADYRSGLYSTAVFEVEGIFNEYAGGDRDPAAIRDFLAQGWANWSTKPRFVTLLGRGSFDYRDLWEYGGNLIPPILRGTPKGIYSADARFADVEGDSRPEFAIGRIPSLTNAEADTYIDKLIAYEESPPTATRANRDVLFLNDDADAGGQFAMHSQRYGVWVTQQPETQYTVGTAPFADIGALRDELFARLNDGAYWLNLTGHGGLSFFAAEQVFTADDVATNLVEAERLPIVTTFSCTLGRFELPMFSALGETLTLAESRGAIAVFAPSGVTYDPAARIFGERLFEESFGAHAQSTLGEAILEASRRFRAEGGADYMVDVYNLLGDSALQLQRP